MKNILALLFLGLSINAYAAPQIINVAARQVKPWPGLVEISYELTEEVVPPGERFVETRVVCEDREHGETYRGFTFTAPPTYEKGVHRLIWNARANGVQIASTNCVFKVEIETLNKYCIIDLSGGGSATNYPVSYLSSEPVGGWTDEYKTSKLVLRYIEPGTFTMGDQVHGGAIYTNIQLTAGFYIGVFEVTQRQWELVMGTLSSYFASSTCYAARPVERVSYDMIRFVGNLPKQGCSREGLLGHQGKAELQEDARFVRTEPEREVLRRVHRPDHPLLHQETHAGRKTLRKIHASRPVGRTGCHRIARGSERESDLRRGARTPDLIYEAMGMPSSKTASLYVSGI